MAGFVFSRCLTRRVKGDFSDELISLVGMWVKVIFLIVIVCVLTFPSVRITLAALLEGSSDYLYESAKSEKNFIPYWLKKVRGD